MPGQYSIRRVNRFILIVSWVTVGVLTFQQYMLRHRILDCLIFLALGLFYAIPTYLCIRRPDSRAIRYWLILGPILYIYVILYIQDGLFDNTFYLFLCIVATSVYFDSRLTIAATSLISVSSTVLYLFFKPMFFPAFQVENFVGLILAIIVMGAILSVQMVWSKQLVQSQAVLLEKAVRDKLTNLYNRTYYDDVFGRLVGLYHSTGTPVSLIVIDIDDFKVINDRYGHSRGDDVLVEVAKRIRAACRKDDIVARVGGEEFIVLLEGATQADAGLVAEKVRTAVSDKPIHDIRCSISVGVAQVGQAERQEDFFDRADRALYQAKISGKNRVELSDGPDWS
jgi:diguanylate cyclase (GGDEF)-like protein